MSLVFSQNLLLANFAYEARRLVHLFVLPFIKLVGETGFEPATALSCDKPFFQPKFAIRKFCLCGSQVNSFIYIILYQVSSLVGETGFEPATALSCDKPFFSQNLLSANFAYAGRRLIHLFTLSFTKFLHWSGRQDLNLRPSGPKPDALPGCATPRKIASLSIKITSIF